MKGILFSLVLLILSGAAFADEYMDSQSKVVYTYEPGSGTAMVKSGFDEVIDDGNELEIVYHPGSPGAFGDVKILDRFTVGNEEYVVKSIGEWAFEENKHIKSVSIPETVAKIGDMAFVSCDSLISVQLPEGLTVIANSLFSNCHSLTSVGIPATVRRIEKYAFSGCSSLSNITIPEGLVFAGIGAFYGTPWYASMYDQAPVGPFYIGPLLLGYKGDKPTGELVIREGTTCIGFEAFNKCDGLTSIIVPPSVTYVEYEAFYSCTGLNAVHISDLAAWCRIGFQEERNSSSNPLFYAHHLYLNGEEVTDLFIPEGTTSIGNYAFDNCTGLTSVTFSDGVTSIGKNTFRSCSNLSSVTIPSSIAAIGANAFLWCRNLKAVHISDLAAWCGISFYGTANPLYYGAHLYLNEREVTSLTIPEGITSIGDGAFICFGSLTSVKIPNSVTSIGKKTFYRCRGVTSVTIGSMVKTIGESAFFDCDSLSDIYCYAENVPETGDDVFGYNISENITLHVPAASIEAYRTTSPWKDFKYIVPIEETTDINALKAETPSSPLFDLQGRRLNTEPRHGVYIKNGKKVVK